MTHIMLDLETWGTRPGCDIRSIGAVVFDPLTGHIASGDAFYIACDNPYDADEANAHYVSGEWRKYPLTRDPRTVQWWSEQSAEAQAAFTDPVDLAAALNQFGSWYFALTINEPNATLWAHGPQFDVSILAAAYDAVNLPIPWHYRAPRDTRTAFDMAGVGDHSHWMQHYNHGTAHNALDDAIAQARAVCGAHERLRTR